MFSCFTCSFAPGGSLCFLRGPDRVGPLHHAAGEGRCQDPDSFVPQPREEGPAGRRQRLDPRQHCPGPLLRHEDAGHLRHQGRLGELAEGRGRREGQPSFCPQFVHKCVKYMLTVVAACFIIDVGEILIILAESHIE